MGKIEKIMDNLKRDEQILNIKIISPLFTRGMPSIDLRPEDLRPPSFRGVFRWWFRALLGGAIYNKKGILEYDDIKNIVKEREELLWGSTEKKGKIGFARVKDSPRSLYIQPSNYYMNYQYLNYLAYGLFSKKHPRKSFQPNSSFNLRLMLNKRLSEEERNVINGTIWAAINLGNFGAKSRRGFGSLQLTWNKDNKYNNEWEAFAHESLSTPKELKEYLEKGLKRAFTYFDKYLKLKEITKSSIKRRIDYLPPFPIACKDYWKIKIIGEPFHSWMDALDFAGEKIRSFREGYSRVTKDYQTVKKLLTQNIKKSNKIPKGIIFGLPYRFYFRSLSHSPYNNIVFEGTEHRRRASPLTVKIWELDNNKYVIIFHLFKARFLLNSTHKNNLRDERLKAIKGPSRKKRIRKEKVELREVQSEDYKFLEAFLNGLEGDYLYF